MVVGKVLNGGVPRTRPRRLTYYMNKKGSKFWRTLYATGGVILRACMATLNHTPVCGQMVCILCVRTLQAWHLVCTDECVGRQQVIECGGEVSRGAECRLQTFGCACVPYMALIYQGL